MCGTRGGLHRTLRKGQPQLRGYIDVRKSTETIRIKSVRTPLVPHLFQVRANTTKEEKSRVKIYNEND